MAKPTILILIIFLGLSSKTMAQASKRWYEKTSIDRSDYFEHEEEWSLWPERGALIDSLNILRGAYYFIDFHGHRPLMVRNTIRFDLPLTNVSYLNIPTNRFRFATRFGFLREHSRDVKNTAFELSYGFLWSGEQATLVTRGQLSQFPKTLSRSKRRVTLDVHEEYSRISRKEMKATFTKARVDALVINKLGYTFGLNSANMPYLTNSGRLRNANEFTLIIGPAWQSTYEYELNARLPTKRAERLSQLYLRRDALEEIKKRERIVRTNSITLGVPLSRNYRGVRTESPGVYEVFNGDVSLRLKTGGKTYNLLSRNSGFFQPVAPNWSVEAFFNLGYETSNVELSSCGLGFSFGL